MAQLACCQPVRALVLDVDGTLLDTESLVVEVSNKLLAKYGKTLTMEAQRAGFGKRPLEAWQAVIEVLGLEAVASAQELYSQSEPVLQQMWCDSRFLPGARRLISHLAAAGVPLALATSTPRATLEKKLSRHEGVLGLFQAIVCGDEVQNGKPAPDTFLSVAAKLGLQPSECVAVEDAPSGVQAATAAGMRVVVVPSLLDTKHYPVPDGTAVTGCVETLPSLLEFRPEGYGLPAFCDCIQGAGEDTVPLDPPLMLSGPVVKGFGRGSKELGIRTANLDANSLSGRLAEAVTGIFLGWAAVEGQQGVHKMVMSVGYNPHYGNKEKTAEPWLLTGFEQDFYGKELRLLVCGYIRAEAAFVSLEALKTRIFKDADVAREALDDPAFHKWAVDPFLTAVTSAQASA